MTGLTTIRLEELTKRYTADGPPALAEISLTIAGGVSVFRGASGSGKTTLLALVGCLTRPTSGRIFLNDEPVSGLPEAFMAARRRTTFGFVFQNFNLIGGLSVAENVMVPAYPLAPPRAELATRIEALLNRLDLADRAHQPARTLSGGQAQRVAIARALINDPEIIIADEPTANLDSALTKEFLAIIGALKTEGRTVLMASHDPRIWQSEPVDRVITLKDGRLAETP